MKKLTVLYDGACGFCVRCRWWPAKQPKFVEMECRPAGSGEARRAFPALEPKPGELTVVDDDGGVYRDTDAFIVCLYGMQEYREWSLRFGDPLWKPFARGLFGALSYGRRGISKVLDG